MEHQFILSALASGDKFVQVDGTLYAQYDELVIHRLEQQVEVRTGLFKTKVETKTEYGPVVVDLYLKGELVKRLTLQPTLELGKGDKLSLHGVKGFLEVTVS